MQECLNHRNQQSSASIYLSTSRNAFSSRLEIQLIQALNGIVHKARRFPSMIVVVIVAPLFFLESSFTACGGIFRSHRHFRISFSCAVENRSQRTFPECYWLLLSMYVIYIAETAYWFGR